MLSCIHFFVSYLIILLYWVFCATAVFGLRFEIVLRQQIFFICVHICVCMYISAYVDIVYLLMCHALAFIIQIHIYMYVWKWYIFSLPTVNLLCAKCEFHTEYLENYFYYATVMLFLSYQGCIRCKFIPVIYRIFIVSSLTYDRFLN